MHDKPLVRFLGQFLLLQALFWFEFKIKDLLPSPHVFCSVCCFVSQCFLVALKTFSLNSVFIEYNINCQPSVAKASEYWEGVCTEYVEVCALLSKCVLCVCVCVYVCVLNIYKMDLDFVGVLVYLSVWNRNREMWYVYCCKAFRAARHAVLEVVGQTE